MAAFSSANVVGLLVAAGCLVALAMPSRAVHASDGAAAMVNEYPGDPIAGVTALIARVFPAGAAEFRLELLPRATDAPAAMQLDHGDGGTVVLRGTGGVELASAFNWYLNTYLNVTYDWNTYAEGQLPAAPVLAGSAAGANSGLPLPIPATSPVKPRQVPFSYYMNVCTYGYSLAFVPWDYWQKHIDWMAMNGINIPLAFVGQEWLWVQIFAGYGIPFEDQASFYSGPAFLPWFRMGNMRGWGGPITMGWLETRKALNIQMLARMRGLGMTPALSAFAGHVPKAFVTKYPNAQVSRSPDWANFDAGNSVTAAYADVYLMEPTDPMFAEIGNKYIALQMATYGTDHIYQCDTYNEMAPRSRDTGYLRNSSAAVYTAMTGADPHAIWLMQGWLFLSDWWTQPEIAAYLGGVATSKMWLLDLFGDSRPQWSRTASFYGHPYFFCTLLNFGGQQGLVGNIPRIMQGLAVSLANSTISGVGITMEGIWTNYPIFELTLQQTWKQGWFERYGTRRYGRSDASAVQAWQLLGSTIYNGNGGGFGSAISSMPNLAGHSCGVPPAPQPPGPPAPKGYIRHHPTDGYWNPPPAGRSNLTIDRCAALCTAQPSCLAFEVYILDSATTEGNCYLFTNISTAFVTLSPCRTYIKQLANGITEQSPDTAGMPEIGTTLFTAPSVQYRASEGHLTGYSHHESRVELAATGLDQAWRLLMAAAPTLGSVGSYRFDLVDVGRQVIAANFSSSLAAYQIAFAKGDRVAIVQLSQTMLAMLDDYDALLSSDVNFMLGRWQAWSRGWSTDPTEQAKLEFNGRNQLTLWGPTGQINDYAKKEWGGLVRSYYKERYALFFRIAEATLANGTAWDNDAYCDAIFTEVAKPWQTDTTTFPVVPESDAIATSRILIAKYAPA